jgi:hypothetical protein
MPCGACTGDWIARRAVATRRTSGTAGTTSTTPHRPARAALGSDTTSPCNVFDESATVFSRARSSLLLSFRKRASASLEVGRSLRTTSRSAKRLAAMNALRRHDVGRCRVRQDVHRTRSLSQCAIDESQGLREVLRVRDDAGRAVSSVFRRARFRTGLPLSWWRVSLSVGAGD